MVPFAFADILAIRLEEESPEDGLYNLLDYLPSGVVELLRGREDFHRIKDYLNQDLSCSLVAHDEGLLKIEEVGEELLEAMVIKKEGLTEFCDLSSSRAALKELHERNSDCWKEESFRQSIHERDLLLFALDNGRLLLEDLSDEDLKKEGILPKVAEVMPKELVERLFPAEEPGKESELLQAITSVESLERWIVELSFVNLAFFGALPKDLREEHTLGLTNKILLSDNPMDKLSTSLRKSAKFKEHFFQDVSAVLFAIDSESLEPLLVPPEVFDEERERQTYPAEISKVIQNLLPQAFAYAGERCSDREWFKKPKRPTKLLMYADTALREDHEFVRELCQGDPEFLKYAGEKLRKDEDFVISLVLANPQACEHLPASLLNSENFIERMLGEIEKIEDEDRKSAYEEFIDGL